jgi:hypothetical protein
MSKNGNSQIRHRPSESNPTLKHLDALSGEWNWEQSSDGTTWEHDFDMVFTRAT